MRWWFQGIAKPCKVGSEKMSILRVEFGIPLSDDDRIPKILGSVIPELMINQQGFLNTAQVDLSNFKRLNGTTEESP